MGTLFFIITHFSLKKEKFAKTITKLDFNVLYLKKKLILSGNREVILSFLKNFHESPGQKYWFFHAHSIKKVLNYNFRKKIFYIMITISIQRS